MAIEPTRRIALGRKDPDARINVSLNQEHHALKLLKRQVSQLHTLLIPRLRFFHRRIKLDIHRSVLSDLILLYHVAALSLRFPREAPNGDLLRMLFFMVNGRHGEHSIATVYSE
jgi:hypothetical protein